MNISDIEQAVTRAVERALSKPTKRLLSKADAAEYLGCSPMHVGNLVARGALRPVDLRANGEKNAKFWFDVRDLDKLIEERKTDAA